MEVTHQWPDGESLLAQPQLAVEIMMVIHSQIAKEREQDVKRQRS